MKQRTIIKPFEISGIGIHSGKVSKATILPGQPDQGIIFKKQDITIPARIDNVCSFTRCTTLGKDGVLIGTVEHLLSACFGLGVSNLTVEVEGDEIPILDGSCLEITGKLKEAGITDQEKDRYILRIQNFLTFRDKDQFISLVPASRMTITVVVDYDHPVIGFQMIQYIPDENNFEEKLAPARTFGFEEEIAALLEMNLARGGSLENALVIGREGYVNPPRFQDEVARHKCLDLLGDLFLTQAMILGHIFAYKISHSFNVRFVRDLLEKSVSSSVKLYS